MFDLEWKENSLKDLEKIDRDTSIRIFKKVECLKGGLTSDVKRMQGTNYLRLRVGDYRVIFSLEKNLITILKVGHRKNIYKDF